MPNIRPQNTRILLTTRIALKHRYKKHDCHFKDAYLYREGKISSGRDITHYELFATSWMIGNQGEADGQPPSGAGNNFHEEPQILHYGNFGDGLEIKKGMVFTIEPMINMGKPDLKILSDKWTAVTQDGKISAQFEHTLCVTDTGVEVMTRLDGRTQF